MRQPAYENKCVLRYVAENAQIPGIPAQDLDQTMLDLLELTADQILTYTSGGEPLYERLAETED